MKSGHRKQLGSKLSASNLLRKPIRKALMMRREESDYIGYIDEVGAGMVRGWAAYRLDGMRRVTVRIYFDDMLVAEGIAQAFREDLAKAGHGDGDHGFQFTVPKKALFCAEVISLVVMADEGEVVCARKAVRSANSAGSSSLYFDASDLIEFLTHHRELSGIQRVQAGYLLGLGKETIGSKRVRICTRFKYSSFYFNISHDQFVSLLRAAGDLSAVAQNEWARHVQKFKQGLVTRTSFVAGDILFTLGAPWALDDHNETIRCAKFYYGVRYVQIFYDLIPISVPEVVAAPLIPHFARAMAAMTIYADHIFSISKYSLEDLSKTLLALGRTVPKISVIPMGGTITDAEAPRTRKGDALAKLGVAAPFVLCVGTLEPRKNHILLFNVWRKLVARHGAANVPKLVLVGRVGWYMDDFMRILKVSHAVDKTIIHLMGVSNDDLSELYDSCLFTIFPSLSEGWGLPITESLSRGKVCVCSDVTSMPEAGGQHALYIDPLDTTAAFDLCEKLIYDRDVLKAHETELRKGFEATTWVEAAQSLKGQFAEVVERLDAQPLKPRRKQIELRRTYKFFNIEASQPDASSTEVFRNFLDQEDALDLLAGWNWFDLDVNCTWACGAQATLSLPLQAESPADLVVYLSLVVPPCYDGVPFVVTAGQEICGSFQASAGAHMIVVSLKDRFHQGVASTTTDLQLVLRFDGSRVPQADGRLLGIGVATVTVFDRSDLAGRLAFSEGRIVSQIERTNN